MTTKTSLLTLAFVCGTGFTLPAQTAAASSNTFITERGPNHKVIQRVSWTTNRLGQVSARTNSYTALATGMHYRDASGRWQESKEEIHLLTAGGAAATNGQHQVYFPGDIYDGVIETVTADGKRLKSRPLGISYLDGSNSVLIAELTNSVGQLLPSGNQVIYTNCFTDFTADLVATYRISGFECDLVFRGQPPGPEQFGLNPQISRLQLLTEFFDTPEPEKVLRPASKSEAAAGLSDHTLKFGDMRMIRGHAFAVGSANETSKTNRTAPSRRMEKTPVYKSWEKIEGRTFLIEELPVRNIRAELQKLPLMSGTVPKTSGVSRLASGKRQLPGQRLASAPLKSKRTLLLAQADLNQQSGVVLDYVTINEGGGDGTLTAGTYFITGEAYYDSLTFDANVVVKYNDGYPGTGSLIVDSTYTGAGYDFDGPFDVVFTSRDDDSIGQIIEGSSAEPSQISTTALVTEYGGYSILYFGAKFSYLDCAVSWNPVYGDDMRWCEFKNCNTALWVSEQAASINVMHCKFENCGSAIQHYASTKATMYFGNVLFSSGNYYYPAILATADIVAENVTVDIDSNFFDPTTYSLSCSLTITNSIFKHDWMSSLITVTSEATIFDADFSGSEFQSSGSDQYYLSTGSIYRDAGTTGIDAGLLAELQQMTTYTPQDGGYPDDNTLDLGFHYYLGELEDFDGDGMEDAWEWNHFGTLSQTGSGDFDEDGHSNLQEFLANTDPNTVRFSTDFTNLYVSNRTVTGSSAIQAGVPHEMAVLVNNTNLATASWVSYSSNFTATLPDAEGRHRIRVALRGRTTDYPPVWDETQFTLDRVPPVLIVTNPASATATVIKPYLQLKGYGNEPLASLSYDITNGTGLLTNQLAMVVDQEFDTNRFDFATNYFQAFDIELTNGVNGITLRVSDRAGNVTVTNLSVTLDYTSATSPPVLAFRWPTNGMYLSGDSFYVRGQINDETAGITAQMVTNGVTNLVSGIVERNGTFWLEDLPLNPGTNEWTVIAVDAAGNLSTTNLSVVKSAVTLAITNTPNEESLYSYVGTVMGTVSDVDATVTVNGMEADVDEYGNWTAENVPVLGQGTATFDAVAAVGGGGGSSSVAASVQKERGPAVVVERHFAQKSLTEPGRTETWTKDYAGYKRIAANGEWEDCYSGNAGKDVFAGTEHWHTDYRWSESKPLGEYDEGGGWIEIQDSTPYIPHRLPISAPDDSLDHEIFQSGYNNPTGRNLVHHFKAGGVTHRWPGSGGEYQVTVESHTNLKLYTGGKSSVMMKRRNIIGLTVFAGEYGKPAAPAWYLTPGSSIAGNRIRLLGKTVGADGKLWLALPDDESVSLSLNVPDSKHFNADVIPTKHKLVHETFCTALTNPNLERTSLGVGEYVWLKFVPALNMTAPEQPLWYAFSGSIDPVGDLAVFTAPSNAATAVVRVFVRDAQLDTVFSVKVPTGYAKPPTHLMETVPTTPSATRAGAYMKNWVYIAPTDVSFCRIQVKEASGGPSSRDGYFETFPPLMPWHNANFWWNVNENNSWSPYPDTAGGDFNIPESGEWIPGSFTWHIPVYWTIGAPNGQPDIDPENGLSWPSTLMTHWDQVFELDSAGKCTVIKFDVTVSRTLDDTYETSETPDPNP